MGCGQSSAADTNNNDSPKKASIPNGNVTSLESGSYDLPQVDLPELRQEPTIEDVDVPKSEPGYPAVRVPQTSRADVYFPSKMKNVDKHARETPQEKANNFQELISYLTSVCTSDIEKVRAIFVWMGTQAIATSDFSSATDNETPLGFMRLIKEGRASYSAFFAVLCRHAQLPCVIIPGYAKSAGYEVGDSEEQVRRLCNSWNAVFVDGSWRFVFPLWACCALVGHSTGAYTKVEAKGEAVREKETQAAGVTVTQLNDYYFLTDPKNFIFVAFPTEARWQLLPRPWTIETFIDVPNCEQSYFEERADIKSKFAGRLRAKHGMCNIELTGEDPSTMNLHYQLYYNHKESGKEISSTLQLNSYVLLQRTDTNWLFSVRCPQEGVYKFEVIGGRGYEASLCDFKIYCSEVEDDCQPYPCNPGHIGFGPSADTERAGVKAKSHHEAIVKMDVHKTIRFSFVVEKSVQIRSELINPKMSPEELKNNIKENYSKGIYNVDITVPDQGEYALQMFAKQKNAPDFKNVCNYLLTTKEKRKRRQRQYENAYEKNTRNTLQSRAHSKGTRDIDELSKAIEKFEALELDDKGDLAAAYDALELKKVQKELKDAINRRHLETLEKAIAHANVSRFREKVTHLIKEAEDVRDHLRKLDRIAHEVLSMQQTTISELRSYKYPPQIVFEIMQAVFLMLGDKPRYVEEWADIQALMGRTGKDGLLRRVRQFDTQNVQNDTEQHVEKVLGKHTEYEACVASAGAGTFYVWLRNVSGILNDDQSTAPSEQHTIERTATNPSTVQ